MKLKTRLLCLILALISLVSVFSGCGAIKGDTVMQLEGYKITEAMYSYWMSRYKTLFLNKFNDSKDTEEFWKSKTEDGITYEKYITDYINNYAREVLISMKLFDDYGLSFTADDKKKINEYIKGLNAAYGSKAELNAYLADYGLNSKTLETIYYAEQKVDKVKAALFESGGVFAVNDEDRKKYYEENYYCAEWIYIYTDVKLKKDEDDKYYTDTNGNYITEPLTEEEKIAKDKKIAELKGKLNTVDFRTLRQEYSEEVLAKYENYPDGVFLSANDYQNYGTEFIKKISETEIGSITEFTEENVLFIIKRYALKDYSKLTTQELNLMKDFESYVVTEKMNSYYAAIEVKTNGDVLSRFDIKTFTKLSNTNI